VTLLLASASPRRAELLRGAGVPLEIAPVDCDETWRPGEPPERYARRIAADKAALALRPDRRILAADTTVWIRPDASPLGKPADRDEARRSLQALFDAGDHRVTTAFTIVDTTWAQPRWHHGATTTIVSMRRIDGAQRDALLERYLDAEEWRGKAGGYAIQGRAAGLVRAIQGSYTGVVGLPVAEVLDALDSLDSLDRPPQEEQG